MTFEEVKTKARERLNGSCRVCRICDGVACRGEVPGMGGKGTGNSFMENVRALERIKVNLRTMHTVSAPDTTLSLFGKTLSMPIMAAPLSGTTLNMGGLVDEKTYIEPVVAACSAEGTLAMVGDTALPQFLMDNLEVLAANGGNGIVFIKPWENDDIIEKIRLSEKAGALAVGVDIDACGLVTLQMHGKSVQPKTVDQIRALVEATELPFILKGIMTADEAEMAIDAGVAAIVVSNHGGRVQDWTPGTADVLEEIAEVVNGRCLVMVDGGVRIGVDVLKMLALGADAVLIGRPFVTASFGGGHEGVSMYLQKLQAELRDVMRLTGCATLKDISARAIQKK